MTAVQELTHTPLQPSLDCSVCDQPWPCAPAKVELLEEFKGNLTSLMVYLGTYLDRAMREAVSDHHWGRVDNLFDRFVGWARSNPSGEGARC
ncbi:hypothetical protein [Actinoplanes sp. NPDC051859]|uniref:hypothetical protein n=1 Tax=Actinoplanes sp. NPDC051859 TaxID=3363909 RepID=UPI0037911B7A